MANKDKLKQKKHRHYLKHKESILLRCKDYYEKNKEYVKERVKIYREAHKEQINKQRSDSNHKQRGLALELLGNKCKICNEVDLILEFHHLVYEDDSIRKGRIFVEVINHPERFWLLCRPCHKILTCINLFPDKAKLVIDIISKINYEKCS